MHIIGGILMASGLFGLVGSAILLIPVFQRRAKKGTSTASIPVSFLILFTAANLVPSPEPPPLETSTAPAAAIILKHSEDAPARESIEEEILSKLVVSHEDHGILIRDGQRKVLVRCKNRSDYHVSAILDIDFFADDGTKLTGFLDDFVITDLGPRSETWCILWLKSVSPIASSKYGFSNLSFKKVEIPSGAEAVINIPSLAKKNQKEIINLLGTPQKDNYGTTKEFVFTVNRNGLEKITIYYEGSQLRQFIARFDPPVEGYRLALEKLGLTATIPPDVAAPAVYRWEERTKLDRFYSVQALRLWRESDKIEGVSAVLHPPE